MQKLEKAVEAAAGELESKAREFDQAVLTEARDLAGQAEQAESDIVAYVVNHRAEILAVAKQYEPQVVKALEAIAEKLLANVKGSFEIG